VISIEVLPGTTPPGTHVAFPPGPCRAEHVEADPAGDLGQPGARDLDLVALGLVHPVPANVGLLNGVFGLRDRAEHPERQRQEVAAFSDQGRVDRRITVSAHLSSRMTTMTIYRQRV
jgi:hypothetical protein